jgi:hypothetical protein
MLFNVAGNCDRSPPLLLHIWAELLQTAGLIKHQNADGMKDAEEEGRMN